MRVKLGFNVAQVLCTNLVEQDDVDQISRWLKEENLPIFSDEQIIQFLVSCDGECEATRKTIKSYLKVTKDCKEIFSNRNINRIDLCRHLRVGQMCILPERTSDGCVIMLTRLIDPNYESFEFVPYLTMLSMTIESAIYDHPAPGLVVITDSTGTSWKHLTRLQFGLARVFSIYLQEGLPVKLHKMCLINATPVLYKVMRFAARFTNAEAMAKIEIYRSGDLDSFYEKCVPKRLLPADYGGEMPKMDKLHENQVRKLQDLSEYFEATEKQLMVPTAFF